MALSFLLSLCVFATATPRASGVYSFATWGFEDFDYAVNTFVLSFPEPVSIMHIEGFVSASMLPRPPNMPHNDRYVRQALLACHNGTRDTLHGETIAGPRLRPGQERRFERSLTMTPVEINIKQQDRGVVHLPVNFHFRYEELIVRPRHGFICVSDLVTYTGLGHETLEERQSVNGRSTEPLECLDLEVHFNIHYVSLGDAASRWKAHGSELAGRG